jgi:hypothetical protein
VNHSEVTHNCQKGPNLSSLSASDPETRTDHSGSAVAQEEEEGQQHDEESESSAEEAREEQTTRRASQRKKQRVADPVSQQPQQTYVCHQCGTDCKESESGMVGCDECESWYCLQCAGLERLPQEGEVWYCCK